MVKGDDRYCASCGSTLLSKTSGGKKDPFIGRTIGNYTIQDIIGVGGMGRVYRAEQSTLGRTVAIKMIHPHLLGDEQTVARFYTEARASSKLNHPNSVSIIDFGQTQDGHLYLAMEFLKGKDLAMVMHEEGPLSFSRIGDILLAVLDALHEAHLLDIVHRDLKPENIILRRLRSGDDLVKVVDFGLATIVGTNTSITKPGLVCGTPDYMAPEQGKGDPVDGRGDLYALGVLLFELLTDQLPYDDETPTKVVLRHINDPIPDPRKVAPKRKITDAVAEVAMKALAKKRTDRYQTAKEMGQALRAALNETSATPVATNAPLVVCPACGKENAADMRFCGSCGGRLDLKMQPSMFPPRTSFRPVLSSEREFVGRVAEMELIESLRETADQQLVWGRLRGEPGVGKTRLLKEAVERFAGDGDLVVGAQPHPTGAPVAYSPIRELLCSLLEIKGEDLDRMAIGDVMLGDAMTRAGVQEVVHPSGLVGVAGRSRSGAAATALASAIDLVLSRDEVKRVVVVVDDFDRCDGLTQQVLTELPRVVGDRSVLLLTADNQPRPIAGTIDVVLHGLPHADALAMLGEDAGNTTFQDITADRALPLHLEQLIALRGQDAPSKLADAIALRTERLGLNARRVLQAIAVLGHRCDLTELREMVDPDEFVSLDELVRADLVQLAEGRVEVAHPYIRDLVEAFIPAAARKALHGRALGLRTRRKAPLQVRAEHAYRAGDPMTTLMLLEQMGDRSLGFGDARVAVLAYQRALELARREMLESGDAVMDAALVTFSRKLGVSLERAGDFAGADGVLREATDLTAPQSAERARLMIALGRVAARRDKRREAMRQFGKTLELVNSDPSIESELQMAIGRTRRDEGDVQGAAMAFRRALDLFADLGKHEIQLVLAGIELAEMLTQLGEHEEAAGRLLAAERMARDANAPALAARAVGAQAVLQGLANRMEAAIRRYEAAAGLSADAGDVAGHRRWQSAAEAMRPSS